jgi:hypothetical protein
MAVLKAGSDSTSAVDDRTNSTPAFGSLDSLTGLASLCTSVPWTFFPYTPVVLISGIWLQPDGGGGGGVSDTQGSWGIF